MLRLMIEYNNTLYRNKISLMKSLRSLNKQIEESGEKCEHISAELADSMSYCIICRKQLKTTNEDIKALLDKDLDPKMLFDTYIEKKINYLQSKLLKVLDENPNLNSHDAKIKLEEKIKEEGYYDREVRSYRKEI